jgi:hypothetical protein
MLSRFGAVCVSDTRRAGQMAGLPMALPYTEEYEEMHL